ncbi:MAG: hypothetical protein KDB27_29075, partial [Planctomycetales bacterium]|nr:hypothetical protein [Planctomycetales bacterium]
WTIELLDASGNVVDTSVTMSMDLNGDGSIDPVTEQGLYWFSQLLPGTYTVREVIAPEFWGQQTTPNPGPYVIGGPDRFAYEYVPFAGAALLPDQSASGFGELERVTMKVEVVDRTTHIGNYEYGSIHGYKFRDNNGNKVQDTDEPRLEGWTIYLDQNNNGILDWTDANNNGAWDAGEGEVWTLTDSHGEFWFEHLPYGAYYVREVLIEGWDQTTDNPPPLTPPSGVEYVAASGQAHLPGPNVTYPTMKSEVIIPELAFGNRSTSSLHGFKFEDYNADGIYDPADGDIPMGGIEFKLIGDIDGDGDIDELIEITDHGGEFWFVNIAPGEYIIQELPTSWPGIMASTPSEITVQVAPGVEYVWKYGRSMQDSRPEILDHRLRFGNFVKGSIHGFKFDDYDKNGVYDPTLTYGPHGKHDTPLPGVPFELTGDANNDGVIDTFLAYTNKDGEFWFEDVTLPSGEVLPGLWPGEYTVTERLDLIHPDYTPTTPWQRTFFVGSREELVWQRGAAHLGNMSLKRERFVGKKLMFGNFVTGSIHGFKFDDFNADGKFVHADGDRGFGGFNFELIMDGEVIATQTSDHGGHFWFEDLMPGYYTVRERVEDFWWPDIMSSTHTEIEVWVGSGEELVFTDGAAHLGSESPQEEVWVGEDLMFGNFVKGSIHGLKFEDFDGDAKYDPSKGDTPWDRTHVEFELIRNGEVIRFTDIDENGEFWFERLHPGWYTVREVVDHLPKEIQPSDVNEITLFVGSGEELVWGDGAAHLGEHALQHEVNVGDRLTFGNWVYGSIHGLKFEDMNADGIFDREDGDSGWGGFGFDLYRGDFTGAIPTPDAYVRTEYSDHGGLFWFTHLRPGYYTIVEQEPSWSDVMPSPADNPQVQRTFLVGSGRELVPAWGAAHLPPYAIQVEQLVPDNPDGSNPLDFGNYAKGSIHGFKFYDSDKDGAYDPNDGDRPGPGVHFELLQNGNVIATETTNRLGEFWFMSLVPGDYTVREVVPQGSTPTTPTETTLTIRSRDAFAWTEGAAMVDPFGLAEETVVGSQLMFGNTSRPTDPLYLVTGRHVFYNESAFDGRNAAANADDDNAIAPDKNALLPGQTATFSNYTSFWRGLNGIMVDVDPNATNVDFEFHVGNSNNFASWTDITGSESSITVRPGEGDGGSDRYTIIWPSKTITGEWLQVKTTATLGGNPVSDLHYWGNAIGETGNDPGSTLVNATDQILAMSNFRNFLNPAPITDQYDFNRDKLVNGTDVIIAQSNFTNFLIDLELITAPNTPPVAMAAAAIVNGQEDSRAFTIDGNSDFERETEGLMTPRAVDLALDFAVSREVRKPTTPAGRADLHDELFDDFGDEDRLI